MPLRHRIPLDVPARTIRDESTVEHAGTIVELPLIGRPYTLRVRQGPGA